MYINLNKRNNATFFEIRLFHLAVDSNAKNRNKCVYEYRNKYVHISPVR